jgi:hypothetical protein
MMSRIWSRDEVLKAVPWLKRQNAKGADIYVRPAGDRNQGLVLVDDLNQGQIERLKADGYAPAVVVETSPRNHQAWIRLSERPIEPDVATVASKYLAKQYDADPNSADWRHYGRLAGFTNRKPAHTDERGRNPFVLAHESPGKAARNAQELLARVETAIDKGEAQKESLRRREALWEAQPNAGNRYDPVQEYQRQAKRLLARYGRDADFSRLDWMIATDMAASGHWLARDIERGIRECSPNIESRKTGHLEDYAKRTAEKAWTATAAHRQQLEQEHQAKRDGPSL